MFESLAPEQKELFNAALFHYQVEYDHIRKKADLQPLQNSVSLAFSFIEHVNELIDELLADREITCKKGCNYCCHTNVDTYKEEALYILYMCKKEKIDIDWTKLKRQRNFTYENYYLMQEKYRKCVFLDEEGSCKIYNFRPITCRKLMSIDDKEKCDIGKGVLQVKRLVIHEVEAVSLILGKNSEGGSLPSLLLKYKSYV